MTKSACIVLLFTAMVGSAFAATSATQKYAGPVFPSEWASANATEAKVATSKKAEKNRKPSNTNFVDASMASPQLEEAIAKVVSNKTAEDFEEQINDLNKNYDKLPPDLKFYTAMITPIQTFHGMAFRMIPLLQAKSRFIHSMLLTKVKSMASTSNVMFPTEHVGAAFDYVTAPYYVNDTTLVKAFQSERDVQQYAATTIVPALKLAADRIEALDLSQPIVWDQRAVFGANSFKDSKGKDVNDGRFKLVGKFEQHIAAGDFHSAMAGLSMFIAYNVDTGFDLYREIGFLYGLDGWGLSFIKGNDPQKIDPLEGVSARKMTAVMNQSKYALLGTLLGNGPGWMTFALDESRKAEGHYYEASTSRDSSHNDAYMANHWFNEKGRTKVNDNIGMINRIVQSNGIESVHSSVGNENEFVKINYSAIFTNPPKDLKLFLPTAFELKKAADRGPVTKGPGAGKGLAYKNYREGMPMTYTAAVYATYFPSVKTSADVFTVGRVFSQERGDWLHLQ